MTTTRTITYTVIPGGSLSADLLAAFSDGTTVYSKHTVVGAGGTLTIKVPAMGAAHWRFYGTGLPTFDAWVAAGAAIDLSALMSLASVAPDVAIAAIDAEAAARQSGDATNATAISTHAARTDNPHAVTAAQVGAYTTIQADALLAAKSPLATGGACLVVAASNAPAGIKARVDYVCDGVADQVEINAALAALPSGRGLVLMTAGQFNLSAPISITTNYARLAGVSFATFLFPAAGYSGAYFIGANVGASSQIVGVELDHFRIYGDYSNQSGSADGIRFSASKAHIHDVIIESVRGSGLVVTSYDGVGAIYDVKTSDVIVIYPGAYGASFGPDLVYNCENLRLNIQGGGTLGTPRGTHGIYVQACSQIKFTDCHSYSNLNDGLRTLNTKSLEVIGGEWETNLGKGINVVRQSGSTAAYGGKIVGAVFYGNAQDPIALDGARLMTVSANEFFTSQGTAIATYSAAEACVIAHNNIRDVTTAGIRLQGGTINCLVQGNAIKGIGGSAAGIRIDDSTVNFVVGNVVEGGITETGTATSNRIYDNNLLTGTITKVGGATLIRRNRNYKTEATGTGTISAATSVTVAHGLATTPSRVLISPRGDPGSGVRYWGSADATNITLSTSASASFAFDWAAYVGDVSS